MDTRTHNPKSRDSKHAHVSQSPAPTQQRQSPNLGLSQAPVGTSPPMMVVAASTMGCNLEEVFVAGKSEPLLLTVRGKGREGEKTTGYVLIDRRVYEVEQFEMVDRKVWKIVQ